MDAQRDLSLDELAIFEILHKSIVLIASDHQKGSAVVANVDKLGMVLITVEHVAKLGKIAYLGKQTVYLNRLKSYNISSTTLFILNDLHEAHFENSPTILLNAQLKIGEKVYFGGYPFNKVDAHLHTGHISSIGKNGEFNIDGVAVSGMSGGPIAIERKGKLYLVGTIASETFDPIEGFSKALDEMYLAQSEKENTRKYEDSYRAFITKRMQNTPSLTTIPKNSLYIGNLDSLKKNDPKVFDKIWEDLNNAGIILNDGKIVSEKVISGRLGLRKEFQPYENDVISRLQASIRVESIDPSNIDLPYKWKKSTDSVNTVALSLVQSLSTGVITGNLFQGFERVFDSIDSELVSFDRISYKEEPTEFEIGKKNRVEKNKKKLGKKANKERTEAIQNGEFQNNGIPPILYRFVSNKAAKDIKENGIIHLGTDLDEIPFITKPEKSMAEAVGAKAIEKMVAVFTDRIPGLSSNNINSLRQRKGPNAYKLNISIPKEAIKISEA